MNFKPQDLFIGVIGLFVILLPGALLIVLGLWLCCDYPMEPGPKLYWSAWEAGLVFFIFSYVLGHVISLVGSFIEDSLSKRIDVTKFQPKTREDVVNFLLPYHSDAKNEPYKVRRWAANIIRSQEGPISIHLERKDADRRFFRNVVVVCLLALSASLVQLYQSSEYLYDSLLIFGLLIAVILRYVDQQEKYTRDVFEHFLAFSQSRKKNNPQKNLSSSAEE